MKTGETEKVGAPKALLKSSQGETVYDVCWYPISYTVGGSFCFLSSCRDHPAQLRNASTGELVCSYISYDYAHEISTPVGLGWSFDGQRVLCGFEKRIDIFDPSNPQQPLRTIRATGGKKRKRDTQLRRPQRGIVSCFSHSPILGEKFFAAGCYDKTIGIYDSESSSDEPELVLYGQHEGGVTHLQFTPDGRYLFSGARRDNQLLGWDIRNTSAVLYRFERVSSATNQRIYFDIDPSGQYLISGGLDGRLLVFDLNRGDTSAVGWLNDHTGVACHLDSTLTS